MKAITPITATGIAKKEVAASGSPKITVASTSVRTPLRKALKSGNSIVPRMPLTGPWALTRKRSIVPGDQFLAHAHGHQAQ